MSKIKFTITNYLCLLLLAVSIYGMATELSLPIALILLIFVAGIGMGEYFRIREEVKTENDFRHVIIKEIEQLKQKMEAISLGKMINQPRK